MKISIVVAVAANGVIGSGNQIPWHLPDDLRHFRRITTGHHVVMGRKTFESIGRPLPNRTNLVITRSRSFRAEGVLVVHSLREAIQLAEKAGEQELMVIGGGQIYREALPLADYLYYTRVNAVVPGEVHFPEPGPDWKRVEDVPHPADDRHDFSFHFQRYVRVAQAASYDH